LQVKSGDLSGADLTLQHIKDSVGMSLFLSELTREGRRSAVEFILDRLIDRAMGGSIKKPGDVPHASATEPLSQELSDATSGDPPKTDDPFLTRLYLERSEALIRWGDLAGARASLDRAVSLIAILKNDAFSRWVARLYAQLGEHVLARSWFQAA